MAPLERIDYLVDKMDETVRERFDKMTEDYAELIIATSGKPIEEMTRSVSNKSDSEGRKTSQISYPKNQQQPPKMDSVFVFNPPNKILNI